MFFSSPLGQMRIRLVSCSTLGSCPAAAILANGHRILADAIPSISIFLDAVHSSDPETMRLCPAIEAFNCGDVDSFNDV